jgi:hypothetical protein
MTINASTISALRGAVARPFLTLRTHGLLPAHVTEQLAQLPEGDAEAPQEKFLGAVPCDRTGALTGWDTKLQGDAMLSTVTLKIILRSGPHQHNQTYDRFCYTQSAGPAAISDDTDP